LVDGFVRAFWLADITIDAFGSDLESHDDNAGSG
jgi:hypothetical protein